jgi:ABC-type glycerol-3-phosphate transport system substrate-binding protein
MHSFIRYLDKRMKNIDSGALGTCEERRHGMRKQKFLTIIAALVLLMMGLAACGGGGGGSGNANSANLTVWGMGTEGEDLKILASDFMKQNPNIHVTVQAIPGATRIASY